MNILLMDPFFCEWRGLPDLLSGLLFEISAVNLFRENIGKNCLYSWAKFAILRKGQDDFGKYSWEEISVVWKVFPGKVNKILKKFNERICIYAGTGIFGTDKQLSGDFLHG